MTDMKKIVLSIQLLLSVGVVFSQEKIDLLVLGRNYSEALEIIDKHIEKKPSANLYFKQGLVYNQLQNYQEALNSFSRALEYEPNNPEILAEMAEGLSILGNNQDATPFYERAVELDPSNLRQAGKLGRNYIDRKDYKKAYGVFSGIYLVDSTNVYWNKQLAFSAFRVGKKNQAIDLYKKVIEQNPRDYTSYFNLVHLFDKEKETEKILDFIDKGLENFPENDGFYVERARLFFALKNYEKAKADFENYFLAGGDSLYPVLMNYGISLYFAKNENKAISILDSCASQVANDPYVLFYLSLSHKKLANYQVAEDYMNAAIESATPGFLPEMYHHLGQIHGQQREFEESIAALKKANEMDPTNIEVLFEIATTFEEYNSNKTLALNYYRVYLMEAGESGRNLNYALDRIAKLKEDLFFDE
jgi:tetratricopeptide (TPR) repeat protein